MDCLSPRAHQKSLISLMFRGTLLESQFSSRSPLSSFCSTPLLARTPPRITSMSQKPCATPQGGLILGRMAEVSSEHTPINFPSRKDSFDTDFNDLATTVAASEITDTIEVGQLTSPLFPQVREVSAYPFGVSASQQQAAASIFKRGKSMARHRSKEHRETCARC